MNKTRATFNEPAQDWPEAGLESVGDCPVCKSDSHTLLYDGLSDRVFRCAPGTWTLYRCSACRSAYLDPRPTADTVHLAYRQYFTHVPDVRSAMRDLGWFRQLQRILANGYRNERFGTNDRPSTRLGVWAAALLPSQRARIEREARNLPRPVPGARLLDVGCGNGGFLEFASRAGWHVMGVDPDPRAVSAARSRGLNVRLGSVESLESAHALFDVITLSHVIEHVHEPLALLRACHRLLKPEGWIWVETPNIDSLGHGRYGPNWRALEVPRHLVLFNIDSLHRALKAVGFGKIELQPYFPLCESVFAASEAMARGRDPHTSVLSSEGRRAARGAERKARLDPGAREFITMKAWR
jgi:2-polyprenyl-3-methyl-5-hydroxy-6-metoxy-1,4-benzoquinol methylase